MLWSLGVGYGPAATPQVQSRPLASSQQASHGYAASRAGSPGAGAVLSPTGTSRAEAA